LHDHGQTHDDRRVAGLNGDDAVDDERVVLSSVKRDSRLCERYDAG
jgi:hypothetical protein